MNNPSFFICNDNNCILYALTGEKETLKNCLGSQFRELDPAAAEGAGEKHIPCVKQSGNSITVNVGSIAHPMTEEHSIGWIYLETSCGGQVKFLSHTQEPSAKFVLAEGETALAAYAYCNLHGFWKTTIS